MSVVKGTNITDQALGVAALRNLLEQVGAELDVLQSRMEDRSTPFGTVLLLEREAKYLMANIAQLTTQIRKREPPFYTSRAWRELRYRFLARSTRQCTCCGARADQGATLHVDHIKPRSKYPELALDEGNLQILCDDCNMGKGNKDDADFRAAIKME
ncbi:HNH endonuclease [Xanthomonas euvesicatoria]|uniref:HNH endonuclease n=1 Tax=Xanthomonas euvesicatoria TaxID=456327 RepID=UPI001E2C7E0B|nr:HNH endonuclease [Xanthomonas euvesicatoria]